MTKSQIEMFIKRISINKDAKIIIKYKPNYECYSNGIRFSACININFDNTYYIINLNKSYFNKYRKNYDIKATLLHELGHAYTFLYYRDNASKWEYQANIWAIKKAVELEDKELAFSVYTHAVSLPYTWNQDKGKYRKYLIASKKFKKDFSFGLL